MNKLNKIISEGFANIDEIIADACYQLDCIIDDSLNKDSISPLIDLMKQSHDRSKLESSMLDIRNRLAQGRLTAGGFVNYPSDIERQYIGAQNMGMGVVIKVNGLVNYQYSLLRGY